MADGVTASLVGVQRVDRSGRSGVGAVGVPIHRCFTWNGVSDMKARPSGVPFTGVSQRHEGSLVHAPSSFTFSARKTPFLPLVGQCKVLRMKAEVSER